MWKQCFVNDGRTLRLSAAARSAGLATVPGMTTPTRHRCHHSTRARPSDRDHKVAPGRVAIYGLESPEGVPVYVHAKVCIIYDQWASVGSDNFNRRSWTHDSELTAAVHDPGYARELRLSLADEHLDREGALGDLNDPPHMFAAFAECASQLQGWHDGGCFGARAPGRLRPVNDAMLTPFTRAWATLLYHLVYDPDGRPIKNKIRSGGAG